MDLGLAQAGLMATPGSPIRLEDVQLRAGDGMPIVARLWARPDPRGTLVVAHGFGEHGGCYGDLARRLVEAPGLDVLAFDFRGHGRSGGKRGVVRRYDDLVLDLDAALAWAPRERPGLPRFLLGHSNGGLVALRALIGDDRGLDGLILSNPSIRGLARVPAWKRAFGELLDKLAPGITLDAGIPADQLSRDPVARAGFKADPLRHSRISPPYFFGMLRAGPETLAGAGAIRTPALVILGEADPLVDPAAGRSLFEALGSPDKTLRVEPGMRHEPLHEVGREAVQDALARWIVARMG